MSYLLYTNICVYWLKGDADLFIAACALANNLILVTNNEKHFRRIENLKLENWREI